MNVRHCHRPVQLTIEKTHFAINGTTLERPIRVATLYRLLGDKPRITQSNPSPFEPRSLCYHSWDELGIYCAEAIDCREVVEIDVTLNPDLIPENRGTIPSRNSFTGEIILLGYPFNRDTLRSEFPSFTSSGFREACGLWMHSDATADITLSWQRLPDSIYIEDGQTKYRDWRNTGRLSAVFFKLTKPKLTFFQRLARKLCAASNRSSR